MSIRTNNSTAAYANYGKYQAYKRSARIEARDVERRQDDYDHGPDPSYGK